MGHIAVLLAIIGVATADVGYDYRAPTSSYGVPLFSTPSPTIAAVAHGGDTPTFGSAFSTQTQTLPGLRVPSHNIQVLQAPFTPGTEGGFGFGDANFGLGLVGLNGLQNTNQYQKSAAYQHIFEDYYRQAQNQPAQVYKHFYVHAAPEEPAEPKHQPLPVLPPPQKHYKVIFIKAPAPVESQPKLIPVPQHHEEKTIVYVLTQKPEETGHIEIPHVEPKPPSKPDVFFVKYEGKEGAQPAIDHIVSNINANQEHINGQVSFDGGHVEGFAPGFSTTASPLPGFGGAEFNVATSTISSLPTQSPTSDLSLSNFGGVNTGGAFGSTFSSQQGASPLFSLAGSHGLQHDAFSSSSGHGGSFLTSTEGPLVVTTLAPLKNDFIQDSVSFNSISTKQGLPHATYGVPKFH